MVLCLSCQRPQMGVRVDMALEIHGRFVHPVSRFFFGARPSFLDWLFRRGWKNSLKKNPKIFRNNCFQLIWWSLATKQLRFAYFVDVFLKPVKKNHSQPGCIFFLNVMDGFAGVPRCQRFHGESWTTPSQQTQHSNSSWILRSGMKVHDIRWLENTAPF